MVIKASCGNCNYSYYSPNDPEELERCKVMERLSKYPINPNALEAINRFEEKSQAGIGFCEYYSPMESLVKENIVFE
jgi:hypothetical protein